MSNSGKVFPILTILISVGCIALGVMIGLKKTQYQTQLSQVEATLKRAEVWGGYTGDFMTNPREPDATLQRASAFTQELQDEKIELDKAYAQLQTDYDTSQSNVQKLTTDLTATKRKLDETTGQLEETQGKLVSAEGKLKSIDEALKGRDPAAVAQELDERNEAFKILRAEKDILDDKIASLSNKVQKFQELEQLSQEQRAPLSLSGKIVAINKEWNFVVLNVGKDDRLVDGIDLTVYRGNDLIAKVRTVSVEANTAIADILPDWVKSEIQVGDQVIF
ncbi:MAG: hypothetical protein AAGA18_00040 [Verrucomicrobiota bacterium]